ncbi:hypothetical protein J1792_17935 [Streptomyces triculaminicus]|uniref:Uncharacterized protein n=2 Tax=Streptomyces TaxID=1883 RepID=A0A939FR99_9ACTN|nr:MULTISPECIES: hypothetical protein [Streptomyces]MBO0654592.1 hypothetical protein [Streptomyces triculaminicus]QSY49196.1 hypothetical protein J3S04_30220 [Streptomyces griseocarneus]
MSKKSKPGDGIRGKGVRGRFMFMDETPEAEATTSIRDSLADLAETLESEARK